MKNYNILIFGISAAIVASASYALIAPESDKAIDIKALEVPAPEASNQSEPVVAQKSGLPAKETPLNTKHYTIQNGDSLSIIFTKFDINESTLYEITHANDLGIAFASITPGKSLEIKTDKAGNLEQLTYPRNATETLVATRSNQGFSVELLREEIVTRISSAQAVIDSSLYIDGKAAGLSDKLIMKLADIFAWDVDFALNLRSGDEFTVLYETVYLDGKEINTGDIIAAEFINRGKTYTAVRFEDKKDHINYYTPDGKSMRKAFLRTPVDFARISSHFNLKRKHPVLNRIRAHKGVDYAAKTGTPVKTTGKGKIIFRGHKGGYGRVVIVQHGQRYSTLYAHLSKYKSGLKVGSNLQQGQVIGYVGMSGLATGPHLHYEFRVNDAHRNPLTVKLPHDQPIEKTLLAEFKAQTQPLLVQLEQAKKSTLVAKNEI
jgi:murein DD-endopeptidase MepM/ murein hydrolase activator NlpD